MTNVEIIAKAKMVNGITEEANTYAYWKKAGYQVRKGEKAAFKCRIWKYSKKQRDEEDENGVMFMKTASFFTVSQCDRI